MPPAGPWPSRSCRGKASTSWSRNLDEREEVQVSSGQAEDVRRLRWRAGCRSSTVKMLTFCLVYGCSSRSNRVPKTVVVQKGEKCKELTLLCKIIDFNSTHLRLERANANANPRVSKRSGFFDNKTSLHIQSRH